LIVKFEISRCARRQIEKIDATRPHRCGVTRVEMDADGILEITAAEIGTGRAASVQIEASSGLTSEEIQRLGQRLGA
jgi:molecular chaperone DnaK